MKRTQVRVPWKEGLHLRPATKLVRVAQAFRSTVLLKCGEKMADARSIISVLLLAASMGAVVDIEVNGEDEARASEAIGMAFAHDQDAGSTPGETPNG